MKFKKIILQNFKSYEYTEFIFQNGIDLIIGENGQGKSTLQEAVFYALFGKPFVKVKLGSLINSIHGKNLKVQLEFEKSGVDYKIVRGIKPNVFEIYKNNEKIEENANIKDFQNFLEEKILKFNELIYKQLVSIIANLSSSKNFVDLSNKEKEELLENVLDISIFNQLNKVIREELKEFNSKIFMTENEISNKNLLLKSEKEKIERLKEKEKKFIETKNEQIKYFKDEITLLQDKNKILKDNLLKNKNLKDLYIESQETKNNILKSLRYLQNQLNEVISELKYIKKGKENFYICKKCNTKNFISIDESKFQKEEELKKFYIELKSKLEEKQKHKEEVEKNFNEIHKKIIELKQMKNEIEHNLEKITSLENKIKEIQNYEIEKFSEEILETLENEIIILKEKLNKMIFEKDNFEKLLDILFKTNAKEELVKQQIKDLNSFIEYFLNKFELDYKIEIQENLKVQVNSLNKSSEFYSLSNGEKARVNFALLFAFLKLIEEKNGIKLNIIFLDEALDSSLDYIGKEKLLEILNEFSTNKDIIIISHSQDIVEKEVFKRVFKIQKDKFSKIKEI